MKVLSAKDIRLIKRALEYAKPYKTMILFLITSIFIGLGLQLIQPRLIGQITGCFIDKKYDFIANMILFYIVIKVVDMVIKFIRDYINIYLNNKISYTINCELYNKILKLPVKAFDEMTVGDFMSRLNGDTGVVSNIITKQLVDVVTNIIKAVAIGIIVFNINILLALLTLIIFPLSFTAFTLFGSRLRNRNKRLRLLSDKYFRSLHQSLIAVRDVKSLGIKEELIGQFADLLRTIRREGIRMDVLSSCSNISSNFILFAISLFVTCTGGYLIYLRKLTIQEFVSFFMYSSYFSDSINGITKLNSVLQQLPISLERIFELIDNHNYKDEKFGYRSMREVKGDIKFNNIFFEYTLDKPILSNMTFHVEPHKRIAIVGRSGAGKSTIFNLLLKLYETKRGSIQIDGIDINELDEKTLKSCISIVRQDPFIFNMTIKENLLLVNKNASDSEIEEVCRAAYIHDYIVNLPDKYNSYVGENGVKLSGGQKQRIAIARGLLKDSRIILFDEATSSLDNESQYNIKKAISQLSRNRTVLIIAHRLSTIIDANEILVVDEGKLVGKGTHNTLVKENDIYKRLYETELIINDKPDSEVS